jgi:hypothetical protein
MAGVTAISKSNERRIHSRKKCPMPTGNPSFTTGYGLVGAGHSSACGNQLPSNITKL